MNPAVRTIPFVKASACGNDFLLIDGALAPPDPAAFTRVICDRHQGVGADGVEWMFPHFSVDAEIRLINADGSPAEISGNGTRCVAAYLYAERPRERLSILTGAGAKICSLTSIMTANTNSKPKWVRPPSKVKSRSRLPAGKCAAFLSPWGIRTL